MNKTIIKINDHVLREYHRFEVLAGTKASAESEIQLHRFKTADDQLAQDLLQEDVFTIQLYENEENLASEDALETYAGLELVEYRLSVGAPNFSPLERFLFEYV